jgi:hypothetical protein
LIEVDGRLTGQPFDEDVGAVAERLILLDVP